MKKKVNFPQENVKSKQEKANLNKRTTIQTTKTPNSSSQIKTNSNQKKIFDLNLSPEKEKNLKNRGSANTFTKGGSGGTNPNKVQVKPSIEINKIINLEDENKVKSSEIVNTECSDYSQQETHFNSKSINNSEIKNLSGNLGLQIDFTKKISDVLNEFKQFLNKSRFLLNESDDEQKKRDYIQNKQVIKNQSDELESVSINKTNEFLNEIELLYQSSAHLKDSISLSNNINMLIENNLQNNSIISIQTQNKISDNINEINKSSDCKNLVYKRYVEICALSLKEISFLIVNHFEEDWKKNSQSLSQSNDISVENQNSNKLNLNSSQKESDHVYFNKLNSKTKSETTFSNLSIEKQELNKPTLLLKNHTISEEKITRKNNIVSKISIKEDIMQEINIRKESRKTTKKLEDAAGKTNNKAVDQKLELLKQLKEKKTQILGSKNPRLGFMQKFSSRKENHVTTFLDPSESIINEYAIINNVKNIPIGKMIELDKLEKKNFEEDDIIAESIEYEEEVNNLKHNDDSEVILHFDEYADKVENKFNMNFLVETKEILNDTLIDSNLKQHHKRSKSNVVDFKEDLKSLIKII